MPTPNTTIRLGGCSAYFKSSLGTHNSLCAHLWFHNFRAGCGIYVYLLGVLWLLSLSPAVHGQQQILGVLCHTVPSYYVTVFIQLSFGKFVYINGCPSTVGEFSGGGIPTPFFIQVPFLACSYELDVPYTIYITDFQGVVLGTDLTRTFVCSSNTDDIIVQSGITVTPASDISLGITGSAPPNVFMRITDGASDKDGASLATAAIGDTARLHIWTDDVYDAILNPNGIDIMAFTIEVTSGGPPIILTGVDGPDTYDGCMAKYFWAEVQDIQTGYVMVEFQIFLLSPPGTPTYAQFYAADIVICVNGTCPNYDCTLNGLGGSAVQAGRRKRDLSEGVVFEKVRVNSQINVDLNSLSEGGSPAIIYREDQSKDATKQCKACTEDENMLVVFGFLATVLLLSIAINCFVCLKIRKRRMRNTNVLEND